MRECSVSGYSLFSDTIDLLRAFPWQPKKKTASASDATKNEDIKLFNNCSKDHISTLFGVKRRSDVRFSRMQPPVQVFMQTECLFEINGA